MVVEFLDTPQRQVSGTWIRFFIDAIHDEAAECASPVQLESDLADDCFGTGYAGIQGCLPFGPDIFNKRVDLPPSTLRAGGTKIPQVAATRDMLDGFS